MPNDSGSGYPAVLSADVDQLISTSDLAHGQEGAGGLLGVYLLTKWPEFSELLSKIKSLDYSVPIPAIVTGTEDSQSGPFSMVTISI